MKSNLVVSNRWHDKSGAALTGWFKVAGKWYYASSVDGLLYKGMHVINGVKYYFDDNGIMQTGQVIVDSGANRKVITTNKSGAVTSVAVPKNGWSSYNGEWYYYQKGTPYTGWVGSYYVEKGHMLQDQIITWNNKRYYVDENGKYQTNKWIKDGWYYAKADGTLAQNEWLKIGDKLYYFETYGQVSKGAYNDKTRRGVYAEDGAYMSAEKYSAGWHLINGRYYYKEGDNFINNKTKKINGNWYLFDTHGRMVTGFSTAEAASDGMDTYWYDDGKFYYGEDGKRCSYIGWKKIDGKWYYFNSVSEAVSGWQNINGYKYYFDWSNRSMYTGYRVINGKLYLFDSNGKNKKITESKDSWYKIDGKWYYIKGGYVVTGKAVINDVEYNFDEYGVWITK